MSNQIGDRYSCSDPNCGCEVTIDRPCNKSAAESQAGEVGSGALRQEFRSEAVSTVGAYGSQGVTGEGVFGGAGSGDRSATASGRYDTESTRVRDRAQGSAGDRSLTCFCGKQMQEAGQQRQQARAATFPNS
jgi:hypothetical protein